jgi:hypothetical protein
MTCKINADTSDGLKLVSDTSGEIDLQTNGTTKVHMDSSGNVGIGYTSLTSKLTVNRDQSSGVADLLTLRDGSAGATFNMQTYSDPSFGTANRFDFSGAYLAFRRSGTEAMRIDSSGNLNFDSGYGSVVTAYGVRAWVNFNGTGTVAIRESGGVSSVADRGTGQYTVVLSTAMPDNNYCGVTSAIHDISSSTNRNRIANAFTKDTNEVYVNSFDTGGNASDVEQVNVVIVR